MSENKNNRSNDGTQRKVVMDGQLKSIFAGTTKDRPQSSRPEPPKAQAKPVSGEEK